MRWLLVGPGPRFLSGVGYHTAGLANTLARRGERVEAVLLRQLVPGWVYPGRAHRGVHGLDVYHLDAAVGLGELDWWWGLRGLGLAWRTTRRHPDVVVLQWWTSAVAHSLLLLAALAHRQGATVILELHETTDVGEAQLPLVGSYSQAMMSALSRFVDGIVVHSHHDATAMKRHFPALEALPAAVVFIGPPPHDGLGPAPDRPSDPDALADPGRRDLRPVRYLYFGVLRSYKGLDELARAFTLLLERGVDAHLTVAGERWEDVGSALAEIARSGPDRHRIMQRYLTDAQLVGLVADCDVVVLPYRRSSASSPLHLAMEAGRPLVTTDAPALVEACAGYAGAIIVGRHDPEDLARGMLEATALVGHRFANPHSWDTSAERLTCFAAGLAADPVATRRPTPGARRASRRAR